MNRKAVEAGIMAAYPSMYRLALTYMRNRDDAMDVVQESAYKAMLHAENVRGEETLRSWLFRIVINTATDIYRKRSRETVTETLPEEGREDVYTDLDALRLLDGLNERERAIIALRFFEDMQLADIADALGENINTVKTTLYRSLKKLRVRAEEGGLGE